MKPTTRTMTTATAARIPFMMSEPSFAPAERYRSVGNTFP